MASRGPLLTSMDETDCPWYVPGQVVQEPNSRSRFVSCFKNQNFRIAVVAIAAALLAELASRHWHLACGG